MIDAPDRRAPRRVSGQGLRHRHVRRMGRRRGWRSSSTETTSAVSISRRPRGWPRTRPLRMAEGQVIDAIDENLPEDEDPRDWNWEALAKLVNTRWKLNLRDRDLKQAGAGQDQRIADRPGPGGHRGHRSGRRRPLPRGGFRRANRLRLGAIQVRHRLEAGRAGRPRGRGGQKTGPRAGRGCSTTENETEYPVLAGLAHFTSQDASGHKRVRPRGPGGLGPSAVRRRAGRRRPEEPAARRNPRPAGRAQPGPNRAGRRGPGRSAAPRRQAVRQYVARADRRSGQRRQRRADQPGRLAAQQPALRAARRQARAARPRAARAASWKWPSKTAIAPRCGTSSVRSCCRSSTPPGKTTCWRWTTSARASACAAMPRSIPRWNTSAKGCARSS